MTNKVVPLRDGMMTGERLPNPDCVAELERLLEMARSGEIVGFHGAIAYYDAAAGRSWGGIFTYQSLGALAVMSAQLSKKLLEEN